jgi:NADP-reducing hydrogenase subunit HndD
MSYIQVNLYQKSTLLNFVAWRAFVQQLSILTFYQINIGIAHGLGNARKLLEDVRLGKATYHAIEVMACPGGCIGGVDSPPPW